MAMNGFAQTTVAERFHSLFIAVGLDKCIITRPQLKQTHVQLYQLHFSKRTGCSEKSEHCWEEKDRPIFNYLALTLSEGVDVEACELKKPSLSAERCWLSWWIFNHVVVSSLTPLKSPHFSAKDPINQTKQFQCRTEPVEPRGHASEFESTPFWVSFQCGLQFMLEFSPLVLIWKWRSEKFSSPFKIEG